MLKKIKKKLKTKIFIYKIIKRYKAYFYYNYFKKDRKLIEQLQQKQDPKILFISCCDSRVDPATLFNLKPGEAFVIRNIANLVPNYKDSSCDNKSHYAVISALEFAIYELDIHNIIVLGHALCAGVNAIINGYLPKHNDHSFINQWISIADEIKKRKYSTQKEYEIENVKLTINNLLSFPWIKKKIDDGSIIISGLYADINSGEIKNVY